MARRKSMDCQQAFFRVAHAATSAGEKTGLQKLFLRRTEEGVAERERCGEVSRKNNFAAGRNESILFLSVKQSHLFTEGLYGYRRLWNRLFNLPSAPERQMQQLRSGHWPVGQTEAGNAGKAVGQPLSAPGLCPDESCRSLPGGLRPVPLRKLLRRPLSFQRILSQHAESPSRRIARPGREQPSSVGTLAGIRQT